MRIFGGFQGMNYEPPNTILKIVFALSLKKMFVKTPECTGQTLVYFAIDSFTGHVGMVIILTFEETFSMK